MNKNILKSTIVLIFTFFTIFSANISNASLGDFVAIVTIDNVKSTIVALDVSGLDPNITNYSLFLSTPSSPDIIKSVSPDNKGDVSVSFSDLIPETKYTVGLTYLNNGAKMSRPNLTSFKTKVAKAKITSFSPAEGKVGDLITIKGEDLFGISKVLFGNTESKVESIISREEITAKVPSTAVDGEITVKTLDYGDAVSASKFKVVYNAVLFVKTDGIFNGTAVDEGSVVLKALNLIPRENYTIYISDKDGISQINNDHAGIKSSNDGSAEAVFSGLKPGHSYEAKITLDLSPEKTLSSSTFTTKGFSSGGEETITVENITATGADITISGTGQGQDEICIYKDTKATSSIICDKKSGGITYSADKDNEITGLTKYTGKIHIDGLVAGTNYIAALIKNGDMANVLIRKPFTTEATAKAKTAVADTQDVGFSGLVPRCNVGEIDATTGQYVHPCNFDYFMQLLNGLIKFLLFVIATPLVALIIMYTGYLYLTAGGSAGQTEKAKHILSNVVIGYIIALAAWLIVNSIISSLNIDPSINTFLQKSSLQK